MLTIVAHQTISQRALGKPNREMCGIAAFYAEDQFVDSLRFSDAGALLGHRGPDGMGVALSGRAALFHARLAIVDLVGGAQPMQGREERFSLVCNGEIYNHEQIRDRLGPERFKTRSDSEVVLHLFEDLGAGCARELDGMYAFFVTDGEPFVAARDALGIKPLYFGRDRRGGTWFASELKALTGQCSSFEELPAGSVLTESGQIERWFKPAWEHQIGYLEGSPEALAKRLERAVLKRLMSDVEVGVFLSGGLDSSVIAELTRRHIAGLKTFAVGLDGAADLEAARLVADALNTRHHEYVYSASEVARELPRVIYHLESYDAALIRSAVPCFFLSKLAKSHVKVALTGEGADEVFAGYDHFEKFWDPAKLHEECVRLLFGLHGMNLQRVDRMTMAHGLEGRVPFLDVDFLEWAMSLDPRLKLRPAGVLEKRLLRRAFEGRLPAEILKRPKQEFSRGSGADAVLGEYAERSISDRDLVRARDKFQIDPPTTKEELLYRNIFEELFPGESSRASVQRWRAPVNQKELS